MSRALRYWCQSAGLALLLVVLLIFGRVEAFGTMRLFLGRSSRAASTLRSPTFAFGRLHQHRFAVTPFITARRAASDDAAGVRGSGLQEGAEVEFITGGRGFLVEKSKGGWWRVAVSSAGSDSTGAPLVVKMRSSAFRLVEQGLLSNSKSSNSNTIAPASSLDSMSEIEAALSQLTTVDITPSPPPPPQPFILSHIEAPLRHRSVSKWVIFSDLHVRGSSIETCEEVLAKVHAAALERQAGIIFLGDFWHVRGALNVELLNRILRSLRLWSQPVIMIPGNHDQVTLGGMVHALEPLVYAFHPDQVLLISEPVVCLGALWIPYRRDAQLMQRILKAGAAARDSVGIVYCHADVRGAYMNDGMRSREGIDISAFPQSLPIYSGHFHKPHTMSKGGASLRYVGSPYQTSLSEAGQDKYLYCMQHTSDAAEGPQWREAERWTLDVGRKYFRAVNVTDEIVQRARAGDRVVLPVRVGEDQEGQEVADILRKRGVEVEIRKERLDRLAMKDGKPVGRGEEGLGGGDGVEAGAEGAVLPDSMSSEPIDYRPQEPMALFAQFMQSNAAKYAGGNNDTNTSAAGATTANETESMEARDRLHAMVLEEGRDTLARVMGTEAGAAASSRISGTGTKELVLESVSLCNFGPFGSEKIHYPLSKRGLVLIRGMSTDGTGADSNGAGKTTLAMSVLWGLTGSMDTRLVSDGSKVDVAYDAGPGSSRRTAEVIVRGTINGDAFEVVRKRGVIGRKADLMFTVGGKDLTTLAVKDTQAAIDKALGIGNGLIQRCCFFGQHSHTLQSLLGLSDGKLKDELNYIVDTELWALAATDVRQRLAGDKAKINELIVEARVRGEERERCANETLQAEEMLDSLKLQLAEAQAIAERELGRSKEEMGRIFGNVSSQQLTLNIQEAVKEQEDHRVNVLQPLQRAVVDSLKNRGQTTVIESNLNSLRERLGQLTALQTNSNVLLANLQNKTMQLDLQLRAADVQGRRLTTDYEERMKAWEAHSGASPVVASVENLPRARAAQEAALSLLAGVEATLEAASSSLAELSNDDAAVLQSSSHKTDCTESHSTHAAAAACPTCGQTLSPEARQARRAELEATVASLMTERAGLIVITGDLRLAVDAALLLQSQAEQTVQLQQRQKECAVELAALERSREERARQSSELETELAAVTLDRAQAERESQRQEGEKERAVQQAEEALRAIIEKEATLRKSLDSLRVAEASLTASQQRANATCLLLEDRVKSQIRQLESKEASLAAVDSALAQIGADRGSIAARSAVMERLADVLGPRGIQHYVFVTLLRQLESISNAYLQVLADGGIQLALQGEEGADKIVKSVWIRSQQGLERGKDKSGDVASLRERALSQLSGGQWRRVSMAMDLAFADIVRRRGGLRSNLIVMDEVLTHLDASGREAVGCLLRSMVEGRRNGEAMPDVVEGEGDGEVAGEGLNVHAHAEPVALTKALSAKSPGLALGGGLGGGAYETAIVILQDLAAMELEEAFDCVDTVVKRADTSRVVLEGEEVGL